MTSEGVIQCCSMGNNCIDRRLSEIKRPIVQHGQSGVGMVIFLIIGTTFQMMVNWKTVNQREDRPMASLAVELEHTGW